MKLFIKKLLLFILLFTTNIALARALSTPNITTNTTATQTQKTVFYSNGSIYLKGFIGHGNIEIYSIIGNKITEIEAQELEDFQFNYVLDTGNMFIVRVSTNNKVTTFKVVAP